MLSFFLPGCQWSRIICQNYHWDYHSDFQIITVGCEEPGAMVDSWRMSSRTQWLLLPSTDWNRRPNLTQLKDRPSLSPMTNRPPTNRPIINNQHWKQHILKGRKSSKILLSVFTVQSKSCRGERARWTAFSTFGHSVIISSRKWTSCPWSERGRCMTLLC